MEALKFQPEGRLIHTEENTSALSELNSMKIAMEKGEILEGVALKCDSNLTLTVALGEHTGIIPKSEAAVVSPDGTIRDIAIITRVGKPVSFHIMDISGGNIILSRRSAQRAARSYFLDNLAQWDIISATVTHLEPFGAFVDIGCGLNAMIGIESISTARIPHPSHRLDIGQQICAAVRHIDYESRRFTLSIKELLGTWEENAAEFTLGETVRGIVRSVKPYGAFVELTPNLSGLTEPTNGIKAGDLVSVFIKAILPEKRKIKLIVISRLEGEPPKTDLKYFKTTGNVGGWEY